MIVVVTRHKALIEYLVETGMVSPDVPVFEHAAEEVVKGKHVIGVLPIHLAALCEKYTNIGLSVPADKRGQELSLDEVREFATEPTTYRIEIEEA